MKTNYIIFRLILALMMLVWATPRATSQTTNILYDCTVPPDDVLLSGLFSWNYWSPATWSCSGGVLTMTTGYLTGVWFGNHETWRPVAWPIGDSNAGNFLSVRAKVAPASGEWVAYLTDASNGAQWTFYTDRVLFLVSTGAVTCAMDTTAAFHDYAFLLKGGQVTYYLDGTPLFSGPASVWGGRYVIIGDSSGTSMVNGYGSFMVDQVNIVTGVGSPRLHLSAPAVAGQELHLNLYGLRPYSTNFLQRATRLVNPNWETIQTVVSNTTSVSVADSIGAGLSNAFYRVSIP